MRRQKNSWRVAHYRFRSRQKVPPLAFTAQPASSSVEPTTATRTARPCPGQTTQPDGAQSRRVRARSLAAVTRQPRPHPIALPASQTRPLHLRSPARHPPAGSRPSHQKLELAMKRPPALRWQNDGRQRRRAGESPRHYLPRRSARFVVPDECRITLDAHHVKRDKWSAPTSWRLH